MSDPLILDSNSNPDPIFEYHFTLLCPECGRDSNMSVVSTPRFEFLKRFQPPRVGMVYRCDACNAPVFLRFRVDYDWGNNRVLIPRDFEQVHRARETFEMKYLPDSVAEDFGEALTCFSVECWNAFAAMCRRTVQAASEVLGAKGATRVKKQLKELRAMNVIDADTFDQLDVIVLAGHDGSHPNLPALTEPRARVLLELMKDVLYQLFVREAKIEEAETLRRTGIEGDGEAEDADGESVTL